MAAVPNDNKAGGSEAQHQLHWVRNQGVGELVVSLWRLQGRICFLTFFQILELNSLHVLASSPFLRFQSQQHSTLF